MRGGQWGPPGAELPWEARPPLALASFIASPYSAPEWSAAQHPPHPDLPALTPSSRSLLGPRDTPFLGPLPPEADGSRMEFGAGPEVTRQFQWRGPDAALGVSGHLSNRGQSEGGSRWGGCGAG